MPGWDCRFLWNTPLLVVWETCRRGGNDDDDDDDDYDYDYDYYYNDKAILKPMALSIMSVWKTEV